MNTSPVCFGSQGKTYGNFTIPETGHVINVKLVYLSGYVNCRVSDAQYRSKWGCSFIQPPNNLAVFITDSLQQRILPTDKASFKVGLGCHATAMYGIAGITSESPVLGFHNFSVPLAVSVGKELQIWYTEDLYDCFAGDNDGQTCTDVFALYA